jgi:diguanylate cyclase (GGDEF)-like protein
VRTGNSPDPPGAAVPYARGAAAWKRLRVWSVVALAVAIGGAAGSVFAARSVANSATARARAAFRQSSTGIAATLDLAIQREQDLLVTATGFFLGAPAAGNAQFRSWSTSVQALQRFPELVDWGEIQLVPASKLAAFAARSAAGSAHTQTLHPIPAGARPYYCLVAALQDRPGQPNLPAALDYCAESRLLALRDTGRGLYTAVNLGHESVLGVDVPFYRGGVVPRTVAGRRAAFAGWMGMSLKPSEVLDVALHGHPRTAVAFRFHTPLSSPSYAASTAVFRAGMPVAGAQSATISLHNGWTVQTFGAAASTGIIGNSVALTMLVGGVVLSLLAGAFVLVLGTGRARALCLVSERTGELRHQALHDPLTGLPNRTLIMDRLEQLLARSRRSGKHGAALCVDLDEFKNVNDRLGHEAGDQLLVAAAGRLKSTLREVDTIGRMSGDEFVVLINGGDVTAEPELVAQRLLDVMRQPFELEASSTPLSVNTSVGIAVADDVSGADLLRNADRALYQAKTAGKNRYHTFNAEMQSATSRRDELEFDLRSALDSDEFRLVYQPIYNLDSLALASVEALLRWQHPTLGLVGPDEFIPILERTGQIREVGRWVLQTACEQMALWQSRGDMIAVSVNVSAVQLNSDAIVDHIREALELSGLNAASLIIEVTETALMGNAGETTRRLQAVKDLGVRIAVDDFGTGYSSLAYLQQFPVDSLKIDRIFTNAITTSSESKALIGTLVQLGNDLGLTTVAEGVETTGQLDQLRGEQVNQVQGFLLSRPLDPDALEVQILAPNRPAAPSVA